MSHKITDDQRQAIRNIYVEARGVNPEITFNKKKSFIPEYTLELERSIITKNERISALENQLREQTAETKKAKDELSRIEIEVKKWENKIKRDFG